MPCVGPCSAASIRRLILSLGLSMTIVGLAANAPDATADSHRQSIRHGATNPVSRSQSSRRARKKARCVPKTDHHRRRMRACRPKSAQAPSATLIGTKSGARSSSTPTTAAFPEAESPETGAALLPDASALGGTEGTDPHQPAGGSKPVSTELTPPQEPGPPRESAPSSGMPEPSTPPPSNELSIAVRGNRLINANGEIVTLHGVDISGTEWQCLYGTAFYAPHDEASIKAMVAWHINAVRIPLNEDCWLGINGAPTDIATYHEEIGEYVSELHKFGIYAILDLHWSAPGSVLSHLGPEFAGFYEMADESHSPAFWESVASYFENDHAVLFDLFNDPSNISWSCWLNGCKAPRGYQTAGMQQLVDVVRATGATQPVMVGGLENTLGSTWLEDRPIDSAGQLVASLHVYNQKYIPYFNTNIGVVAARVPVVAGEIGEMDCADQDLNAFLPWADEHGVSYVAWAWFVGDCASYPSLISSYSGTPTNYGIGYREHLLATFPVP
jgi:endoglucanase